MTLCYITGCDSAGIVYPHSLLFPCCWLSLLKT